MTVRRPRHPARAWLLVWAGLALGAQALGGGSAERPAQAEPFGRVPRASADTLAFAIEARLHARTLQVEARGTLRWRNDSPVPVPDVWLHLYLNAFRHRRTTFMTESGAAHRGNAFDERYPGGIDLTSFRQVLPEGAVELVGDLAFERPDDGNPDDETVARLPLREPIAPGQTATFELAWTARLPRVFARTGFGGPAAFFMVAQWFPKPGVWEPAGPEGSWAWTCHQFHGSSEFYADYGTYEVEITVPQAFRGRVGATGARVPFPDGREERENPDGTVTVRHRAEHVHDFAWVCGEDFVVHTRRFEGGAGTDPAEQERVARVLGLSPADLDLPPVEVHILLQPEHADQLERHWRAAAHALTYMGFWFGPYPYPTLTVVDPDHRGRDAGGMEYPTLITGGTGYLRPRRQTSPEGVIVHEFGHQHFYGLVGTNEFRHAWMDEGLTTYATAKVLDKAYAGWTASRTYAGLPHYAVPVLDFGGIAASGRAALPWLAACLDGPLDLPFGELGVVRDLAGGLGVRHPPARCSLWLGFGEVTPLAFLREVPPLTHLPLRPSTAAEHERGTYAGAPVRDPIAGPKAWEYMDRRSYGVNSYARTSASLRVLEGLVGEETALRMLRRYAERHRFGHPRPEDFLAAINEQAAREGLGDLGWWFEAFFERAWPYDFGVRSIETRPVPRVASDPADGPAPIESIVTVERPGEVRMPLTVLVRFADGSARWLRWERDDTLASLAPAAAGGRAQAEPLPEAEARFLRMNVPVRGEQARWIRLRFVAPHPVTVAEVDPFGHFPIDRDRLNDGRRREPVRAASLGVVLRALGQVELSTSFYGGL